MSLVTREKKLKAQGNPSTLGRAGVVHPTNNSRLDEHVEQTNSRQLLWECKIL